MITAIEKLIYVEMEIKRRKGVWADTKLAVFEAIAEDYRKQVAAADRPCSACGGSGFVEIEEGPAGATYTVRKPCQCGRQVDLVAEVKKVHADLVHVVHKIRGQK
jgi:hypothetical protein